VTQDFPQSVLFCCDHNATRSPMAEGLMKKFYGHRAYVQSAGVKSEMEIDGFAIAVCAEMGSNWNATGCAASTRCRNGATTSRAST
jgi:protein-tyrosine-phosphatase